MPSKKTALRTSGDGLMEKLCSKCSEWKPATNQYFHVCNRKSDSLAESCKVCRRKWAIENSDYRSQYNQEFSKTHREDRNRYAQQLRDKNKQRINELRKQWREKNPERTEATNSKRRALILGADGFHTAEDVRRQFKAQKGKCYWCDVQVGKKYHLDHVFPLSKGGSNGPENIVISCPHCNDSKLNKMPHEWSGSGKLL